MQRLRQPLLLLAALCAALPARASEVASEIAMEAEHAAGGQLPQMQPQYFAGQLFWLVVSFILLYALLRAVALPRIERTQGKRNSQRAADLSAAASANDHAKQIIADYEKSLAGARQQAQQKLSAIVQTAQAHAAQQQAQQNKALQEKLAAAEQNIAALRVQALGQVRDAAVDVAQEMVRRLTGIEANAASVIDRLRRDAA